MSDLPYVISNGKLPDLIEAVTTAGRPDRFGSVFLEKLGFSSSNDRAFIPLFRKLGLIGEQGVPTPLYDDLRDGQKRGRMLAQQIRLLYNDLFAVIQNMQNAADAELRGAIARVTGKDENISVRIANTFKALTNQADFSSQSRDDASDLNNRHQRQQPPKPEINQNIQPVRSFTTIYRSYFPRRRRYPSITRSLSQSRKILASKMTNIKQFFFNALLVRDDLLSLSETGINLDIVTESSIVERAEQMGFPLTIMAAAGKMASLFVLFFCMENSAREIITQRLTERFGINWWDEKVPVKIRSKIDDMMRNEQVHRYHTARSSERIGYTTFGNLEQIIIANWQDFEDLFPDQAWIKSRFSDMERSRNIIMHTGILSQFEIDRLDIIARDWIRQVG